MDKGGRWGEEGLVGLWGRTGGVAETVCLLQLGQQKNSRKGKMDLFVMWCRASIFMKRNINVNCFLSLNLCHYMSYICVTSSALSRLLCKKWLTEVGCVAVWAYSRTEWGDTTHTAMNLFTSCFLAPSVLRIVQWPSIYKKIKQKIKYTSLIK